MPGWHPAAAAHRTISAGTAAGTHRHLQIFSKYDCIKRMAVTEQETRSLVNDATMAQGFPFVNTKPSSLMSDKPRDF